MSNGRVICELEKKWSEWWWPHQGYYSGICLERLWKIMKSLSHKSQCSGQELKPSSYKIKVWMLMLHHPPQLHDNWPATLDTKIHFLRHTIPQFPPHWRCDTLEKRCFKQLACITKYWPRVYQYGWVTNSIHTLQSDKMVKFNTISYIILFLHHVKYQMSLQAQTRPTHFGFSYRGN